MVVMEKLDLEVCDVGCTLYREEVFVGISGFVMYTWRSESNGKRPCHLYIVTSS